MTRITRFWLSLAFVLLSLPLASGVSMAATDIYSAAVPVPDQGEAARERGLQEALGEVIVRVSGDRDAALSTAGRSVTERARQLIQGFGYKRVQLPREADDDAVADLATDPNAEPEPIPTKLMLQVQFNPGAVNNALRRAGLPVWGSERPKTMLWLAQADNGNADLVLGTNAQPLKKIADQRGVPIVLPRQDAQERQRASAADVLAGNDERLRSVARGYDSNHLLIGKIANDNGLWEGQMDLQQGGQTLAQWQSNAATQEELLEKIMARVADTYASSFAVSAGEATSTALVAIDRLGSAREFARASDYLAGLTAVKKLLPVSINPDYAVFRVEMAGNTDMLRRSIGLADWLAEDEAARDLAAPFAAQGMPVGYRITP